MDSRAVLARFDAEIRADPPAEAGVDRVWADGVLRTVGAYNFIGWGTFGAAETAAAVTREAAYFRAKGVQWKVFDHDGPPNLAAALLAAGFEEDGPETFLALDLEEISAAYDPPPGIDVREVKDPAGAADLVA